MLPSSTVVARVLGETVVFGQRSGVLARVDEIGAFVLAHRDHFTDRRDAAAELTHLFGAEAEAVSADLRALESMLQELDVEEPSPISPIDGPSREPPSSPSARTWIFDALGATVRLCGHSDRLAAIIEPLVAAYPPSWTSPAHRLDAWDDDGAVTLTQDGRVVLERAKPDAAVNTLTACVTVAAILAARETIVLHAAAVVEGQAALLIGGGTGQGKSTTTVELLSRGMTFLTDELVELDPASGSVRGLARPIGLEGPARHWRPELRPTWLAADDELARWPVPPTEVGQVGRRGELRLLAHLEFTRPEQTSVAALDPLEALGRLCALTFNRERLTERVLGQLGALLSAVPSVVVHHDGARPAANAIADHWSEQLDVARQ